MADLQEAANQFIEDLVAQNVAGLMGTFTPEAMQKAMSMGQGPQPQGPVTHKEARLLPAEGDDHPVDLVVGTDTRGLRGLYRIDLGGHRNYAGGCAQSGIRGYGNCDVGPALSWPYLARVWAWHGSLDAPDWRFS